MAYSGGLNFKDGVGVFVKCDDDDNIILVTDAEGNELYAEEGE